MDMSLLQTAADEIEAKLQYWFKLQNPSEDLPSLEVQININSSFPLLRGYVLFPTNSRPLRENTRYNIEETIRESLAYYFPGVAPLRERRASLHEQREGKQEVAPIGDPRASLHKQSEGRQAVEFMGIAGMPENEFQYNFIFSPLTTSYSEREHLPSHFLNGMPPEMKDLVLRRVSMQKLNELFFPALFPFPHR